MHAHHQCVHHDILFVFLSKTQKNLLTNTQNIADYVLTACILLPQWRCQNAYETDVWKTIDCKAEPFWWCSLPSVSCFGWLAQLWHKVWPLWKCLMTYSHRTTDFMRVATGYNFFLICEHNTWHKVNLLQHNEAPTCSNTDRVIFTPSPLTCMPLKPNTPDHETQPSPNLTNLLSKCKKSTEQATSAWEIPAGDVDLRKQIPFLAMLEFSTNAYSHHCYGWNGNGEVPKLACMENDVKNW